MHTRIFSSTCVCECVGILSIRFTSCISSEEIIVVCRQLVLSQIVYILQIVNTLFSYYFSWILISFEIEWKNAIIFFRRSYDSTLKCRLNQYRSVISSIPFTAKFIPANFVEQKCTSAPRKNLRQILGAKRSHHMEARPVGCLCGLHVRTALAWIY